MKLNLSRREMFKYSGAAIALGAISSHSTEAEAMSHGSRQLKFEFLGEMSVKLELPQNIGSTPHGNRMIFYVKEGTVDGPKLKGKVLLGGGDWYCVRKDGVGELDVKATIQTDDGALIYAHYGGLVVDPQNSIAQVYQGKKVKHTAYYFRTAPRFETSSKKYNWLNNTIAVGVGEIGISWVGYSVYAIL